MSVRIVIADDHGVLRAGLRALLNGEPDFRVVGEAADAEQAIRAVAELSPDVLLMDISMPGIDGIEATRCLTAEYPQLRVLLLTVHEDTSMLQEAINAGASGYILKRAVESELINAIRAVNQGSLYVHPAMTRGLLKPKRQDCPASVPSPTLTLRELEVLRLIALGYTNRQIAENLSLSIRTVESHRAHIMEKLNLHSRVELVRFARQNKIISSEG